ncbi:hypothetical protein WJX75_007200 [Coccomyxa subellipsoidea]|uniref:SET domain-containing protein n=1 Tax=Coccomyxa subellipsoidea TaxID=248742 RepID=A0ABR2YL66_9CHLO
MGADEGNPTSTGPEAADVPRPVRDMDAADVAAPAEPNDEQMPASDQQKADQIDEEGAKEDAAQHAGADSIDQPLEAATGAVEFAKAADSQRVVWARVKGFPHWPAQVLTEKEAAVRMEHVFRPSPLSVPVMFFGTLEIAWIAPVEVVSWADGVKAKYLKKNKTRRKFLKSVEEVHEFLAPGPKRRKAPEGWWKKAINPPKPKPKETVLEIGELGSSTQAAKPGASKGAKGGSKVANGLGVHTNSKVAKRVQRPTKRIDGADEDELKALLGDEAEADATAVPKRRGSAGRRPDHPAPKPPHYEALRRNLWTSRPRPKRLPKDDIPPQPAGPEDADAPMTARAPQSLGNDVAAPGRAENTLAAEAHAPIAVPGPSAVLVPPAAVANAAKAAMPERIGCGENCLNRLSYIHCDPKQCPCGEHCSNRPFHLLPVPKTELFLTDNRGWGVKAAEQIPRGTFIVEYAGEVIEDHECRRRMAQAKENGQQHFYMMELAPGLIIDARNKGNMARFINSSCSPNCESQKWHDAATGEIRIGIFAADDIEPGTELAYDYQFQHAGLAQDAGAYRCMCGAPNCRGTMDTQPERFKDFGKRVEVFWDGDSVYYRGTVTAYSTTSGKHTILYDDNDIERVDLKMVRHRWLDESAPMKLSPLHAALVAQSGILGPEPLDLNDGPDMPLPQAALPKEAQLEITRPVRKSRGIKRKQADEADDEELAQLDRMEEEGPAAQDARVPKQKMLMKRCQRESQEQGALRPGPSGLQAQQAPLATSWATPDPAGAAQLTANFGAPLVPPQLQLPAPFNAPPFAMPPHTLPQMPAGLPGQNSLQVAMYQMLLMTNPQLMQAHKAVGGTMPQPQMPMASLQQMFATFANAAAATSAPAHLAPWPPGGGAASQMLPPMAPLQLGPLTPAGAASGPGQPPSLPMTPNFWDKEGPLDSSEPPASQAVETAADTAPSPLQGTAPKEKLPKQTEPEEDASADSHAVPMAVNNCAAAPLEADNGSALPSAEPDTDQTAIATSEAPAVEETAGASAATPTAAADLPQDSLPVAHADERVQPGPDNQSQLAADAGAALIGSVREEATGTPGKGASEQSKEQSQLATDAGAALLGDVQHATAVSDEPPRMPTQDADTPSPPSELQNTVPAQQSAGEQQPSTAAPEAEQSGEQPVFQPATGVTPAPWRAKSQQRLFDPTAALTNGYVSPASGAAKLSLQGLIDPMVTSAAVGPGAAAVGPAVPPAEDVDAEVDEAELWGSLLVDSPSPCKAPKPAWAQDPSLWRANGPGPAPPPLGQ